MSEGDTATVARRFAGPVADEVAFLFRPGDRSRGTAGPANGAYRAMADALTAHGASFADLASETLLLRDVRRDLPAILAARTRILAGLGQEAVAPPVAFIQQAPAVGRATFELVASAVIPRDRGAWSVRDVRPLTSCACEGCARSAARTIRLGDQVSLHSSNLYGSGNGVYEQAWNMFRAAESLLDRCGLGFRDVVRTWIHLRDIDRDYDGLNAARREFLRHGGIELRPASTGVQGIPLPDAHDCSLIVEAVKSDRPPDVSPMSTPSLNEAWTYGADFSRGLRVVETNKIALHVSGTASIDEGGRTVHAGDLEAQVGRMLDNVDSLLARQGATFADLICGVTSLKHPGDSRVLRSICERRGFTGFPCAVVEAALCRRDLLCETEAVAMLPPQAPGA